MNDVKLFNDEGEREKFVSTHDNPFRPDKVKKISLEIEKSFWTSNKVRYQSKIDFENNNTRASHKIEAKNFNELVQKTEDYIKSL